MRRGHVVLALVSLLLSACGLSTRVFEGPVPPLARGRQLQGALIDMRTRYFVAFDTLVTAVSKAHVVAVGEEHYHPDIQAFELHLLRALVQRRPQHLALGMEFLERDAQPTVDAYVAGTIDQEAFQKRLKASSWFMQHYFPLVHYARQAGLPVIALNLPRRIARRVAAHGLEQTLESLSSAERVYLPSEVCAVPEGYRSYFLEAVAKSHKLEGAQAERFVTASYLKDVVMAETLAGFLKDHADFTVLAIAGRFHIDYGTGIPALLRQRLSRVIVRQITTIALPSGRKINLRQLAEENIADYLRLFPPAPEGRHTAAS